jgi:arginine:pyruvate transaminase
MPFQGRISDLSQRLLASGSPDTWAVHDEARGLLERGETVFMLSVGDPDLATQPSTIRAAIDSLQRGRTHYAPGMGELNLRQTIAAMELRFTGKHTDPSNVVIFPGATNAIYSVMACLLNPGDEVVVAEPRYIGYDGIMQALNARLVTVPLLPERGFAFDLEAMKAAVTARTNVVFLNTPGNPAGNLIGEADLRELAAFCFDRGIWLVCDEVYSTITFEEPHVSLRQAAAELDNVVVIDGLSKSHAMTGWRLGWTIASTGFSRRLLDFTSTTVFGCAQFVQDAAAFALTNDQEYIRGVREEYRQRRNYVCERVAAIPGLTCSRPQAGMFVMVNVSELAASGEVFARELLDRYRVSVLPGGGFGNSTAAYVRVSLAQPVNILSPAFDRIADFGRARLGG